MRDFLRGALGAALALGMLAGCGRQPSSEALSMSQALPFTPAAGAPESVTASYVPLGFYAELQLTGQHFLTTGAYSINLAGPTGIIRAGIGAPPYPLPVGSDGTVNFFSSFPRNGMTNPGWQIAIIYHANGNLADFVTGKLVLSAQLPTP